jgi:hypothetical protein
LARITKAMIVDMYDGEAEITGWGDEEVGSK